MSGDDPVFPSNGKGGLTKQELLEFILFAISVTERGDVRLKNQFPDVDLTTDFALQVCLSSAKATAGKFFEPEYTTRMENEMIQHFRSKE